MNKNSGDKKWFGAFVLYYYEVVPVFEILERFPEEKKRYDFIEILSGRNVYNIWTKIDELRKSQSEKIVRKLKWLDDGIVRMSDEDLNSYLRSYMKKEYLERGESIVDTKSRINYYKLRDGSVYGGTLFERLGGVIRERFYPCKERCIHGAFFHVDSNDEFYKQIVKETPYAIVVMDPQEERIIQEEYDIRETRRSIPTVEEVEVRRFFGLSRRKTVVVRTHEKKEKKRILRRREEVKSVLASELLEEYARDEPLYYSGMCILAYPYGRTFHGGGANIVSIHFYLPKSYAEDIASIENGKKVDMYLSLFKEAFPNLYRGLDLATLISPLRCALKDLPRYYYDVRENSVTKISKN